MASIMTGRAGYLDQEVEPPTDFLGPKDLQELIKEADWIAFFHAEDGVTARLVKNNVQVVGRDCLPPANPPNHL